MDDSHIAMSRRTITCLAALVIAASGLVTLSCQAGSPPPPPEERREPTPGGGARSGPTGTPTTPEQPTASASPGQQAAADLARRQLSQDRGMRLDQIQVVTVDKVDWPDTSLGCPEPGMMYAQMITPGYKVLLTADGASYEYHTEGTRRAVLCKR